MNLLLVCSHPQDPHRRPGAFERAFDSAWADRFLKHLTNQRDFCTGCGDRCVHCRDWRVPDHSADIAGVIRLPSLLPELLDDPQDYLPPQLPPHDVLVAIEIHEEVLIELPRFSKAAGGKALIAPTEAPEWISRWAAQKLREKSRQEGIECAIPKPFCSLTYGVGATIDEFIRHFRLGRPEVTVEALEGRAAKVMAKISAPCGNSHYVAHSLQGYPLDEIFQQQVCRFWHAYPCTASMKLDPDLNDTILHRGGQIHMEAFCSVAGLPFGQIVGCVPTVK